MVKRKAGALTRDKIEDYNTELLKINNELDEKLKVLDKNIPILLGLDGGYELSKEKNKAYHWAIDKIKELRKKYNIKD